MPEAREGTGMKLDEIPHRHPHHQQASASATAALATLRYPAAKEDIIAKVGDWPIPYAHGVRVPFAQIIEALPEERFDDVAQAINAVDLHWGDVEENLAGKLPE